MARRTALVPHEVELDAAPETASVQGVVAAHAQMSDALFKIVALMVGQYTDMAAQLRSVHEQSSALLERQLELAKLQEDLLDRREDRKLKRERERAHDEFLRDVTGDIRALLPAIANRLGKVPVLTEAESAVLRPFVEGLTDDEKRGILATLSPAKQAALLQLLEALPETPMGSVGAIKPDPVTEGPNGKAHH